jgi:glycerophosphoryl diester phosphodiesterase
LGVAAEYLYSTTKRGIDSEAELRQIPDGFDGYVWTNRIEVVGPLLEKGEPG